MNPELHAIVVGLWWLAGPFIALGGTFCIVREILRPPRHVQDLIARVDRIETARAREQAKLVRLTSVVRATATDVQALTGQHDAIVIDPPPVAEVSTLRLIRPPSEPDIVATLRKAGRPLTRAALAERLGRPEWDIRPDVRTLWLDGVIEMAPGGHTTERAYQVAS